MLWYLKCFSASLTLKVLLNIAYVLMPRCFSCRAGSENTFGLYTEAIFLQNQYFNLICVDTFVVFLRRIFWVLTWVFLYCGITAFTCYYLTSSQSVSQSVVRCRECNVMATQSLQLRSHVQFLKNTNTERFTYVPPQSPQNTHTNVVCNSSEDKKETEIQRVDRMENSQSKTSCVKNITFVKGAALIRLCGRSFYRLLLLLNCAHPP